jgi:hypothetical protein
MDQRREAAPVTRYGYKGQWSCGGRDIHAPRWRSYPVREYRCEEMPVEHITGMRRESQRRSVPAARCSAPEIFCYCSIAIVLQSTSQTKFWSNLLQKLQSTRPSLIQQICSRMLGLQLCHSDPGLNFIELFTNCLQS